MARTPVDLWESVYVKGSATVKVLFEVDDTPIEVGNGTKDGDLTWFLGASTRKLAFDASASKITETGLDHDQIADTATAKIAFDASANEERVSGPMRMVGYRSNLSNRFELVWVAGQRGKPSLNADIQNAAEGTRMIADPDFEILGNNASSDDSTFYAEGGIQLQTDGGGTDAVILLPHLDANQSAWAQVTWGTDQQTEWECEIATAADITASVIHAGLKLTNTPTTATDDNQAFFRFAPATNGGKWQALYSIAGVDTAVDTGVLVAASTRYHLKVTIDSARVARFYINGALVATSTALANAIDLIPYIGILESEAVAKTLYVFGQAISRKIGA